MPPAASSARSASTRMRRGAVALVTLAAVAAILAGCTPRNSPVNDVILVNQARGARGLRPLNWDAELARKAQSWAEYMASQGRLVHSTLTSGVSPGWRALGENVGYGSSIPSVHDSFMRSRPHREAILSSRFDEIGVGVVERGGRFWVVEVFRG